MRLRQLGTTQSVVFYSPPEVHQSILDLCQKSDANLDSSDVIRWLLDQTCVGIEQLRPLFYSQGVDFCRRTQATIDYPDFLNNRLQRDAFLQCLRQSEQQSLQQLYGVKKREKIPIAISHLQSNELVEFMKELAKQRTEFTDTGEAVHSSALQEVEQEREVAFEVETVRKLEKPVHYKPLTFGGLHEDIRTFASTGRLYQNSTAFERAFHALRNTRLGQKHRVRRDMEFSKLFVSTEFANTVLSPSSQYLGELQVQYS